MDGEILDMVIADVEVGLIPEDFHQSLKIFTNRGDIDSRYYHAYGATAGIVFVGDMGEGYQSPAHNVYDRLAIDFTLRRVSSLHLQYRQGGRQKGSSDTMVESILDTIAGVTFLQSIGIEKIAVVGHSFGGVIAIQAATICDPVVTVIAIAPESYGSEAVADLAPRCSLLLLHGTADTISDPANSLDIHEMAQQPKQIIVYDGAKHDLNTVADGVYKKLHTWILTELTNH